MHNPIRRMADRADERNRIMEYWMSGYGTGQGNPAANPDNWVPAIDVLMEESGDLVIVMELPGVRQEDIEVSLSGGDLTVCGHKDGHEDTAEYYTRERYEGPFQRTVSLPDGLEKDRISCHFERGKMEITIRNYAEILESEAQKLEIQGSGD